jgi:hypothetical protein
MPLCFASRKHRASPQKQETRDAAASPQKQETGDAAAAPRRQETGDAAAAPRGIQTRWRARRAHSGVRPVHHAGIWYSVTGGFSARDLGLGPGISPRTQPSPISHLLFRARSRAISYFARAAALFLVSLGAAALFLISRGAAAPLRLSIGMSRISVSTAYTTHACIP